MGGADVKISDAVSKSLETGRPIAAGRPLRERGVLHLWPTDTAAAVIMTVRIGDRWERAAIRWNPTARDLTRDDWYVVPTDELWPGETAMEGQV